MKKMQFPAAAWCVFMSVISVCCCMAVGQLALGYQWGFSVGAAWVFAAAGLCCLSVSTRCNFSFFFLS